VDVFIHVVITVRRLV